VAAFSHGDVAPEGADRGNCQCRKLSFPKKRQPRKEVHVVGLSNSREREDLHWGREMK